MLVPNAQQLIQEFFSDFWSLQTTYTPSSWISENPARGQCVPSALAIQKYLGGEIVKCTLFFKNGSESHYWDIIGDDELDTTFIQYKDHKIDNEIFVGIVRKDTLLLDHDTRKRYEHFMNAINASSTKPADFFSQLKIPHAKG